jgi:serine/threonine protein kinase
VLTSGHLLADRYRLGRRIAVGGMGEVWEAVDVRLDRTVAIKVLKPELCGDAVFLHRFRTEARTTASLNHPGIAAVHDYGETAAIPDGPEDTAYLVMELVEGEPLAAILARQGRISADTTLDMLEQAGHALQAAHERGLVHRDVKPGNILVTPNGTVKLTDFGIAKAADAAPVTRSGMVMGTAHYIAPEQALGSEATPSSDVYSLAVVGYECLMGHRPFLSDNAVTVAMLHIREAAPPLPPDVPPGVRALIETTLVKDPRRRYSAGGEFASAAASVRAGLPLPAPVALAIPPQQRQPPQRNMGTQNTGVRQIPTSMPNPGFGPMNGPATAGVPLGNTYPPGAMSPQVPAPRGRSSRFVIWVLVAGAVLIILIIVVGSLAWRLFAQGSSVPGRADTRPSDNASMVSLDSPEQVGQTALGHLPRVGTRIEGWFAHTGMWTMFPCEAGVARSLRVFASEPTIGGPDAMITHSPRTTAMYRNEVGEPRKTPLSRQRLAQNCGSA